MAENITLDYAGINDLIPHRVPFLLIDRAEMVVAHESIRGIKDVSANEPYFAGHFPGHPIMPGVLIIEAMAQTAATLVAYSNRDDTRGKYVYFTGVDKARFRAPVFPGCVLNLDVKVIGSKSMLYKMDGIASVDGKTVATATFAAMIVDGKESQ